MFQQGQDLGGFDACPQAGLPEDDHRKAAYLALRHLRRLIGEVHFEVFFQPHLWYNAAKASPGGVHMMTNWLKKLFTLQHQPQRSRTNELSELFQGNFFVMFIPVNSLFEGADTYKLKYAYGNLFKNEVCHREAFIPERFDTAYFLDCLTQGKFIAIGLNGIGTLVFTNHRVSALFHILQSHYRNCTSYVFCATDNAGYFKKLEGGKIVRKIASHLVADGIGNNPETRGQPCEFELDTGRVFKIDLKATWMDDMLKDFGKAEILALFDYYVGLPNLKNENITHITIYSVNENPHG